MFELELSWVTEATKGKHEKVPAAVQVTRHFNVQLIYRYRGKLEEIKLGNTSVNCESSVKATINQTKNDQL